MKCFQWMKIFKMDGWKCFLASKKQYLTVKTFTFRHLAWKVVVPWLAYFYNPFTGNFIYVKKKRFFFPLVSSKSISAHSRLSICLWPNTYLSDKFTTNGTHTHTHTRVCVCVCRWTNQSTRNHHQIEIMIDLNATLIHLRLFYAKRLGNRVHCTFIFPFFLLCFLWFYAHSPIEYE